MIPSAFDYKRPDTIEEALRLLQEHEEAKILAGGQSLIPSLRLRLSEPSVLIDISRIEQLRAIQEQNGHIVIGAGVTHGEIADSELIQAKIPMLSQAGELIGDPQVRHVGTLAGSLAHADPAADWPSTMLATEAIIVVHGANGSRQIPASDFFQGLFMTALDEKEIITEIRIPTPSENTTSAYLKFMQPASRFAVVGCAAMITRSNGVCEKVRVAFSGVSPKAFRDTDVEDTLMGKAPDAANIEAAASKAAEGVDILSDHYAGEAYRKHLAKVYAKRTLTAIAG